MTAVETGKRIKELRKIKKISGKALGDAIGKNKTTIYRYEAGLVDEIPALALKGIADVLGTTPEYLLGLNKDVHYTDTSSFSSSVGRLVTFYRNRIGLTIQELSERVGIPATQVQLIESGQDRVFDRELMLKFASAFNIEASRLINETSFVESIGKNMKAIRELSMLEEDVICASTGIEKERYMELEAGADPSFDEINAIISFYKIPAQWLINYDFSAINNDNRLKVAFHLISSTDNITDDELNQIVAFIDFILSRRKL